MSAILRVAVPTPLPQLFDYLPASGTGFEPQVGCRILVPHGHRTLVGVIVELPEQSPIDTARLRPALEVLDHAPVFDPATLELCRWASQYYHQALGETLHAALPLTLRREQTTEPASISCWVHTSKGKGLAEHGLKGSPKQQRLHQLLLAQTHVTRDDLRRHELSLQSAKALEQKGLIELSKLPEAGPRWRGAVLAEAALTPSDEQQGVLQQLRFHRYATYLLEGSTGSGKTEVYLQAIARVLGEGRQALVLVPEIGLTPLTVARFKSRFQVPVVELHSNVAAQRRTRNWLAAGRGQARIVIGTRLAVFTPMPELGIVIVDEEHDASFKQQDGLRYSARDVAIKRAHAAGIPLLLGSATPSLESLHNAITGRYEHLRLTRRAGAASAPVLHCLDMRREPRVGAFAQTTLDAIAQTLARGEQVLVFINRRGFAPALLCEHCGWVASCSACSTRLTLHQSQSQQTRAQQYPPELRCHHCDARQRPPARCPSCHHRPLTALGQGTERLEQLLMERFRDTPVYRVDQDSMQRKQAMSELTETLLGGAPCILVGTQMLAKGHHFPRVTLAVLMDVDQALFSGDFRALERLGQQVVQVAGRAGREALPGQVLLQTFQPDHPLLTLLLAQGYHRYARALLTERRATDLPPFWAMALLRAESKRAANAQEFLQLAVGEIRAMRAPSNTLKLLGPMPALLERRQERYRYLLQVTARNRGELQRVLAALTPRLKAHALAKRVRWALDVDPIDTA